MTAAAELAGLTPREDRFVGCLLGTACGDALGAPVEGDPSPGAVRDFRAGRGAPGSVTDDTQMTLALAASLVRRKGAVDGADCARRYAARFDPRRGYGGGARRVLAALGAGADWRSTGTLIFPAGSFGNGAAMRIAPVGLLFGPGSPGRLSEAVADAVRCTHVHPEAVEGATIQARAVGLLVEAPRGRAPDATRFLDDLAGFAREPRLSERLDRVGALLGEDAGGRRAARELGTGIRTADSLPAALWAFLRHAGDPEAAMVEAVSLGGDTDTLGAMTGALAGALHGARTLPARWLDGLERGRDGFDGCVELGRALAALA